MRLNSYALKLTSGLSVFFVALVLLMLNITTLHSKEEPKLCQVACVCSPTPCPDTSCEEVNVPSGCVGCSTPSNCSP